MKNNYFFILIFSFTSCSVLFPDGIAYQVPNYTFAYQTFNKRLDYNNKKYVLNTTQFGESNHTNSRDLKEVIQFFKKQLKSNVILKRNLKDDKKKFLIPFSINYDITTEELEFINKNTSIDYVILSKILYLDDIKNWSLNNPHKKKMYYSKAGAVSFIKIIDVKNKEVLLEMNCTGEISKTEDKNLETGELERKLNLHKNSYSLGVKSMNKLFKKIK